MNYFHVWENPIAMPGVPRDEKEERETRLPASKQRRETMFKSIIKERECITEALNNLNRLPNPAVLSSKFKQMLGDDRECNHLICPSLLSGLPYAVLIIVFIE